MNGKKLYRIEEGKMLAGVCGGVAEYFNMDITVMRVLWVIASLCTGIGAGIILYIVMAIIVPTKSEVVVGNIVDKKDSEKKN